MNAPEVWWSPSLAEDLSQGGLIERTGPDLWHQEHGLWHQLDELPADAVRLVPELAADPATILAAWRKIVELVDRAGTSPASVVDRVAYLAEQADPVPDTGQVREIHNLLGQLADRSTSPDVLDSATEHVVRTNVRNSRPTSARFVGLVLAELDQARATRPSGDTVQAPDVADLAYARSEVDKWLADNDPYCILPTRTEHIPALLARLDELEGTR